MSTVDAVGVDDAGESNKDYEWDEFRSEWYKNHNYEFLRPEDLRILSIVRDHFAAAYENAVPARQWRGVDVGAGPNLYPMLAMLPYCRSVTLLEYAQSNVDWLREQVAAPDSNWDEFWQHLCQLPSYRELGDWRSDVAGLSRVEKFDVLDSRALSRDFWDMGTMFFVAESITGRQAEFERSISHFTTMLRDGAPFAVAFMRESKGYQVYDREFPALRIEADNVERVFEGAAHDLQLFDVEPDVADPIRLGYSGMIVATGFISRLGRDMKIQPRQQLLDVWCSLSDPAMWTTAGCGRAATNPIQSPMDSNCCA